MEYTEQPQPQPQPSIPEVIDFPIMWSSGLVIVGVALGRVGVVVRFLRDALKLYQAKFPERAQRTKIDDKALAVLELFSQVLPGELKATDVLGQKPEVIAEIIATQKLESYLSEVLRSADSLLPGEKSIVHGEVVEKLKQNPSLLGELIADRKTRSIREKLNDTQANKQGR